MDRAGANRSAVRDLRVKPSAEKVEIALVGYQDQGNLGLGYLAAVVERRGWNATLYDIRDGGDALARRLKSRKPLIVGFSLIFQFFLPQYREVARELRAAGIKAHFTIGGHYPSLCHEELLANFPEIDSVVRYEGEETLIELAERLRDGRDWRDVAGLAYTAADGDAVATDARALVPDLDDLPFPKRPDEVERIVGYPTLPVLASRGCVRRCSFCSIHTFYRTAPGKVVRVRKPEKVVEEMLELRETHDVRVFLFQDDDFPLWGKKGRRWADDLMARLHSTGLARDTIFKISCRAEYVEDDLFGALSEAGLFLVYMGLESGVEGGLDVLFKQTSVEQNIRAVATLKRLGIAWNYGFMLFDPSSTFESIRGNAAFLREIVGDGSTAAVFSRMLPYGGTPIRDTLAREGRLRGDLTHPDYDFLDPRINDYHRLLTIAVRPWIHNRGLSYSLANSVDELETIARLAPAASGCDGYRSALRLLAAECNERLLHLVESSSLAFERGDLAPLEPQPIADYCKANLAKLDGLRREFLTRNMDTLISSITGAPVAHPVMMPQAH
ncbi:radical SAM protein [uncultured Rhodoblastus sp.]|uniref:B12-binding domain-containing radical SAM protein n=1 Tax=uncultured Rhodoblastus sp. TaxID=543037 RepID=UPI0025EEE46C|nr:radical SAM protein [uncultured Rhodoblastus sp.]